MRYSRLIATLLVAMAVVAVRADEPKPKSLDAQLLDDLGDSTPAAQPTEPTKPARAVDRQLLDDLDAGEDIGQEKKSPLQELGEKMKHVEERIRGRDTSETTLELQREISDQLAKLIEQAKKQGKQGGNSNAGGQGKPGAESGNESGNPSAAPASESTQRVDRTDTVERGSADVKDLIRRVWGHLPDKMREQMQNSIDEQFLPKYETLIEEYYRRLAEQPSTGP